MAIQKLDLIYSPVTDVMNPLYYTIDKLSDLILLLLSVIIVVNDLSEYLTAMTSAVNLILNCLGLWCVK